MALHESLDEVTASAAVTVTDGPNNWFFDEDTFNQTTFGTGRFPSTTDGTLEVDFRFADSDGLRIASGTFELELKPDWWWGITFRLSNSDPTLGCFGCLRVFAFPISASARTPQDSLWVVVGGNTLDNSLVF